MFIKNLLKTYIFLLEYFEFIFDISIIPQKVKQLLGD